MSCKQLQLEELRRSISSQANIFDQVDSKIAATLGFAFIAIFQIMAGIFRADPKIFHRTCILSVLQWFFFGLLIITFSAAMSFGVACRWPRVFSQHAALEETYESEEACLDAAISEMRKVEDENYRTLETKNKWGRLTYIAVGFTVLSGLGLCTVIFISVAAF